MSAKEVSVKACLIFKRVVRSATCARTFSDVPVTASDVAGYFEPEDWEAAKHDDIIGLGEVRRALASGRQVDVLC